MSAPVQRGTPMPAASVSPYLSLRQVRLINLPVAEVARLWRIGQTLASSATLIGTSLSGTCLTSFALPPYNPPR